MEEIPDTVQRRPARSMVRRILSGFSAVLLLATVIFLCGPRVDSAFTIRGAILPEGDAVALRDWIEGREGKQAPLLRPNNEAQLRLNGDSGEPTAIAYLYIHGFSASPREIYPLMDHLADARGGHLYIPRLAGHGFTVDRMGEEASLQGWIDDTVEALQIGRMLGQRVVLVGYSNGANLAVLAAASVEPSLRPDALVLIAPNFLPADPAARYLAWPWARWWIPRFFGRERMREAANPAHGDFWSLRYSTEALFAMKAGVRAVRALDLGQLDIPTQVIYAEHDRVVSVPEIERRALEIGPVSAVIHRLGPEDFEDPGGHILAGDAFSPSGTPVLLRLIDDFLQATFPELVIPGQGSEDHIPEED